MHAMRLNPGTIRKAVNNVKCSSSEAVAHNKFGKLRRVNMAITKFQRWSARTVRGVQTMVLVALSLSLAHAGTLSGVVQLSADGKPLRLSESTSAVVYFKSAANVPLKPAATPYVMRTERKTFVPGVLAITQGSQVSFPNSDPILHNAFSTAQGNGFDTGLYGKGEGESAKFNSVGVVRVFCNVHHSMTANILVLNTPFFASPDAQGRFSFKNLPDGPGELFVWHDRANLFRKQLVLVKNGALEEKISMSLSRKRIPPHLNKFGKPYRRSNEGGY
jgi:plastocyanin